ncbi:hypothetical protein PHLGIDRAFT_419956 [Phlebiopsis gigantea 11061_1 CR5-6]|uniref:C2H2-type domain-containing protein n=1 Tax=Phlebiopsis gigantea (strain 11061_1 CR5-6) TaxID=745531 RepID=A0A0C3S6M7_PHLG1|nr:hypothetical protein PHLGIDRAFT_419956 [Phlebiopsis gigantea 11061_1 CR5-6]
MISCTDCTRTFGSPAARKQHVTRVHRLYHCPMCARRPFTEGGLGDHVKEKHGKRFWRYLFFCQGCGFCTLHEGNFNDHYRTSTAHKSCATCDEPYVDRPIEGARISYARYDASLRQCNECKRCTLSYRRAALMEAAAATARAGTSEVPVAVDEYLTNVVDDLETTVGGENC